MRDLKMSTNKWLKDHRSLFPDFENWGKEYYCVSRAYEQVDMLRNYIRKQQEHHGIESFDTEIQRLTQSLGMDYFENSLR